MTIQYTDGRALNAVLLSRTETTLRVSMEGSGDVAEFSNLNGAWISADCEPVAIVYEWQRHGRKRALSLAEGGSSRLLAGRLAQLLFAGSAPETAPVVGPIAGIDPSVCVAAAAASSCAAAW